MAAAAVAAPVEEGADPAEIEDHQEGGYDHDHRQDGALFGRQFGHLKRGERAEKQQGQQHEYGRVGLPAVPRHIHPGHYRSIDFRGAEGSCAKGKGTADGAVVYHRRMGGGARRRCEGT